jgi:hypothetical protein
MACRKALLRSGGRGVTVAEILIAVIVLAAVAITATSAVGGGLIKLGSRNKLVLLCQDPAFYNNNVSRCSNP